MYYAEPNIISIMRDRVGSKSQINHFNSNMNEEQFNESMEEFKKNYPNTEDCAKEYPRPKFIFPALNSEDGNSIHYFTLAIKALKQANFSQEAIELQHLLFSDFKEHFGHISQYLDIGRLLEFEEYQEQTAFAKKRGLSLDVTPLVFEQHEDEPKQLPEFISITIPKIKKLIESDFDFNSVNVFGRNMLWYVDTPEKTSYLLNNTDINIFHIDNTGKNIFQKCFLHEDIECSYGTFITIVDNMKKQNLYFTKFFLDRFEIFDTIVDTFEKNIMKDIVKISPQDFNLESQSLEKYDLIPDLCSLLKDFDKKSHEKLLSFVSLCQQNLIDKKPSSYNDYTEQIKFINKMYENMLEEYIPNNNSSNARKNLKF